MSDMSKCQGVHRRPGTSNWHYRRRVPLDLVPHYGRTVLTFSLGTINHRGACEKGRAEAHRLDLEFVQLRERLAAGAAAQPTHQLTQAKAQELAARWLHETLAEAEEARSRTTSPTTEEALEARAETLAHLESDAAERLATGDYGVALQDAKELLEAEGLDLQAHPLDYSLLARELLKARVQGLRIEQRRTWGDYSDPVPATTFNQITGDAMPARPAATTRGLRLDQALEKYIEGKSTKWTMPSARAITPVLKGFVAMVSADPQSYREAPQAIPATALDRDPPVPQGHAPPAQAAQPDRSLHRQDAGPAHGPGHPGGGQAQGLNPDRSLRQRPQLRKLVGGGKALGSGLARPLPEQGAGSPS